MSVRATSAGPRTGPTPLYSMKKPRDPLDPHRADAARAQPPPCVRAAPELPEALASAVLPAPFAPADRAGSFEAQHFVLAKLIPRHSKMIHTAQAAARIQPAPDDETRGPVASRWKDSSGEGAASALESLKLLEQRRLQDQPQDDERPASE